MAIGTAAAIGLGVAGVGSVLGSKSQSKAASKAADTSLQVAQQNNALARDIYGQNKDILNPYVQRGNPAGATLNALLGIGGTQQAPQQPAQQGFQPNRSVDTMMVPNALRSFDGGFMGREAISGDMPGYEMNALAAPTFGMAAPQGGVTAQQAANDAFNTFRNSTGYQFRVNEGNRALNSGWAGAGTLQSGAAGKSFADFGQNIASQEFGNYLGYLGNQQGVGLGAGSALAGVGQNYVNTISANNNSAGSAAANAALIKGQNNPFANVLGTLGGGILGRLG